MQYILLFILSCFFVGSSDSNHNHDCSTHNNVVPWSDDDMDRLEWSADHRLNWNDFLAEPPRRKNSNVAAITSSVIQYKYACENGYLNFDIKSIFLRDESWVRDNARTSDYLQHEQLHFDITEVFARKLRNRLSGEQFRCNEVYKFERIVNEQLAEWRKMQKRYDIETEFSLNYYQQDYWDEFVPRLLKIYEKHQRD